MMIIKFFRELSPTQPLELLKQSSTNNLRVPHKYNKVTIDKTYYVVTDLEYDYDNGSINVKLIER